MQKFLPSLLLIKNCHFKIGFQVMLKYSEVRRLVQTCDRYGNFPLHIAAKEGYLGCVKVHIYNLTNGSTWWSRIFDELGVYSISLSPLKTSIIISSITLFFIYISVLHYLKRTGEASALQISRLKLYQYIRTLLSITMRYGSYNLIFAKMGVFKNSVISLSIHLLVCSSSWQQHFNLGNIFY